MNGTAGQLVDLSNSRNNGTIYGAQRVVLPSGASTMSFNGVNNYVSVRDSSSLDSTTGLSVEAMFKADSLGSLQTIVSKSWSSSPNSGYTLWIDGTTIEFIAFDKNNDKVSVEVAPVLAPNTWYHVVATHDGNTITVFVNGVKSESMPCDGLSASNLNLTLGRYSPAATSYLDGSLEMVRIYNRALNAGEVANNYNTDCLKVGLSPVQVLDSYTINLTTGWNLISLPVDPADNSVYGIFPENVQSGIVDIWGWNEAQQNWIYYSPDPNDYFYQYYSAITELESGKAYWVEMNKSGSFTVEGTIPSNAPTSPVALVSGWNFIGCTGLTSAAVTSMYPDAIDVWGWNEAQQNWIYYSPDPNDYFYQYYTKINTIQPGKGYWVEMP
jgi:hypothetical protein